MRAIYAAALLFALPAVAHAQRTQLDVTVAGAPGTVAARVQAIYADAQFSIERVEPALLVAEVPLRQRDLGGRAGTRAFVRTALIPVGTDSTRVVITGRIEVPQASILPAESIPVSDKKHREYGKTNTQAWAAMERTAARVAADSTAGR